MLSSSSRPQFSSLAIILVAIFWVSLLTAVTVYFYPRHVNTLYLQNNYISSSHTDSSLATVRTQLSNSNNKPTTTTTTPTTTSANTATVDSDDSIVHFYHMCAPDHIGAQPGATPRTPLKHSPSTLTHPTHPSTEATLERLRQFDGSGHAYLWADVWPSISQGNISLQSYENYLRLYIMEFAVDTSRQLITFNIVRETKHSDGLYGYRWVGSDLLRWWTHDSPDVQLECAHAYGSDATAQVEHVVDAFVDNDRNPQLHCHYSTSVELQDRIPTFTTLRFRNKHAQKDAALVFPTTHPVFVGKKWEERWKAVPDFTFTLPWCRASRPRVYLTAFIKPAFGDPIYIGEMLLNYIHWHRVIGVDHFYVFDRYGKMLPTSETMTAEWENKYKNDNWQFYSLADYIRAGVVTYIPSPCQHDDGNLCERYQDHLPTGETSLALARQHTTWMVQSDLDEFVNLLPRMTRPDGKVGEPDTYTPFSGAEINEHAQQTAVSQLYYERACGNSLYCRSPLRDFLDQYARYGVVTYRTWNVAVAPPQLDTNEIAYMKKEQSEGAVSLKGMDIDAMVAKRHWMLSHWMYKATSWEDMHEKYICQPKFVYEWGVHGARTTPLQDNLYLMPDRGIFMSHYKWQWEVNVTQNFAQMRDTVIAQGGGCHPTTQAATVELSTEGLWMEWTRHVSQHVQCNRSTVMR